MWKSPANMISSYQSTKYEKETFEGQKYKFSFNDVGCSSLFRG